MTNSNNGWQVDYYKNSQTKKLPVKKYNDSQPTKTQTKIFSLIERLKSRKGRLPMPLSRYLEKKLWELRIKHGDKLHRIVYFTVVGKTIVLLHAFPKSSKKTPKKELQKALTNKEDYLSQKRKHEKRRSKINQLRTTPSKKTYKSTI